MKLFSQVARDVAEIRRAQARAHDAYMALPLTTPRADFERFTHALEHLSTVVDLKLLNTLSTEMEALAMAADAQRPSMCAGLQGYMS